MNVQTYTPTSLHTKNVRTIRFLLQKEFRQIFRNRAMWPIIFVMPLIQLILLGYAATFEVENTRMHLIDEAQSPTSHRLVEALTASGYFTVAAQSMSNERADEDLLRREVNMILHIPRSFERDLTRTGTAPVQIILNAEDGFSASVIQAYATTILADFSRDISVGTRPVRPAQAGPPAVIDVNPSSWYNPELAYDIYMVPGILVILVTMIGMFLTAMNVVKEKETGTIEQINVTPIEKWQFITGKLMPFWIIGMAELAVGLALAKLIFAIPMAGSLFVVFGVAAVYLVVVLGIGLWISTLTETQQQAMFIAWFIMVIFILMGGLFTPIESMPPWAQDVTVLNPVAHFIEIMRRVLVKGASWTDIQQPLSILALMAVIVLPLAIRQYRKVSA